MTRSGCEMAMPETTGLEGGEDGPGLRAVLLRGREAKQDSLTRHARIARLRPHAHVASVAVQLARGTVVGQIQVEDLVADAVREPAIRDRHHHFDAAIEVARHQVRAADVDLLVAAVAEVPDPAVLEEAADDAADADAIADAGNARAEAA